MNCITILAFYLGIIEASLPLQTTTFWQIRREAEKNNELKNIRHGKLLSPLPNINEVEGYDFEQYIDHFEFTPRPRTYLQRYWMNRAFWKGPDGPVLLYVGGESVLSGGYIAGGHIVDIAKEYGALLFAVEHRYYGKSNFFGCLKTKNMRYLSSQLALADLAQFVAHAKNKFGLTDKNKWITYGGSYPGSLSAWFRIKYPHLVIGAVASSAPVEAQTDFKDYNNVVASSLSSPLVGGSKLCMHNIEEAFKFVDRLLDTKNFKTLEKDFIACNDISKLNDTWMFASNLAGFFMGLVQYNNQVPGINIAYVCKQMNNASRSPYKSLSILYKQQIQKTASCSDFSYENFMKTVKTQKRDPDGFDMIRQWYYQSCTQFGYFQTCEPGTHCVFSKRLGIINDMDLCQEVFEIALGQLKARINFTNEYYGGKRPRGSKIVFVNGSIDPWHSLSVVTNQTSSEVAVFIPGTSHCANMGANQPNDPPALVEARRRVTAIVGEWLKEAQAAT
ncbi:predicted protein [Nematostella vectensis]|uniref:Thymus-specific serine protease n=1 Tax=Nematostella vectensis TaxID=45351 RepID=A7SYK4_NEMVE|nr:predicted protein [Nematostella vectensis]|eukprot:XP_001623320.1 predicted protein [Nematostella vectensis]